MRDAVEARSGNLVLHSGVVHDVFVATRADGLDAGRVAVAQSDDGSTERWSWCGHVKAK